MFNFLHKKKLVGRVPVSYLSPDGVTILLEFLLYERGTKRTCEAAIKSNASIVKEMYTHTEYTDVSEFVCRRHRKWQRIIKPWIDGGDLNCLYTVDSSGMSIASKLYMTSRNKSTHK